MAQFKRFSGSESESYNSSYVGREGELTWDPDNGLRIHDGNQNGGNPVGISNFYDLTNRPFGNTAVHDLIGGSSSDDNGKFLQQDSTGTSVWAALPSIPADVSDLTDTTNLLSGGSSSSGFETKNANFTAEAGKTYWLDSGTSTKTVTLPASPTAGDWVKIYDGSLNWTTYNLTVNGNGNNIRTVDMGAGQVWGTPASTATLNQSAISPTGPLGATFVWNGTYWHGAA